MSEKHSNNITAEGLKAIQDRLEYLKTTGRAQIAEQIAVARSFGDLSETRNMMLRAMTRRSWKAKFWNSKLHCVLLSLLQKKRSPMTE